MNPFTTSHSLNLGLHPSDHPINVDVYIQIGDGGRTEKDIENEKHSTETKLLESFSTLSQENLAHIPWCAWFSTWFRNLRPAFSPIHAYELTLKLTTDDDICRLNRDYRQVNQPTDVLAFATIDLKNELPDELCLSEPIYLGDIVLSIETAYQQAQAANHSITYELAWLASHGLLHLLGWDHPDEESLDMMLTEQRKLVQGIDALSLLTLPDP